ncbi:hypothetical protein [Ruegeria meonggei]|uniref:Uncharacterized protein n=1 Tax=Ruegeria meonggei TaxID=1446476 RepID=A0A1X7ACP8_9RHOB|nr:hypothetical protein [Ruegeria meonggei]SLN75658.1 hypothetical protein RUM8411_04246 [Ruegeria meonggei]
MQEFPVLLTVRDLAAGLMAKNNRSGGCYDREGTAKGQDMLPILVPLVLDLNPAATFVFPKSPLSALAQQKATAVPEAYGTSLATAH